MYGSVIIVLLAILSNSNPFKKLSFIININWIIAGILALGLFIFFLVQPGAIPSLTLNFLICGQRLYEGWGGVYAEINTFGVPGTRPTGLARYAGVMALIALVSFFYNKKRLKIDWFLLFVIFLLILLFSKGSTEMVAFIIAVTFVVWLMKKINIISIFGICLICLLFFLTTFYNIPCNSSFNSLAYFLPHISLGSPSAPQKPVSEKPVVVPEPKPVVAIGPKPASVSPTKPAPAPATKPAPVPAPVPPTKSAKGIMTLGGRTSGVWTDAWRLFLSNPLVGYGFQADRFFLNGQQAHNSIVQALVQAGILGTVPFVLAFVLTFIILLKLFRRPDITGKDKSFLIGLSAALVFFAVRSTTESVAYFSADWLFVAPIIAYIQCLGNDLPRKENNFGKESVLDFLGNKINIATIKEAVEKISDWIKLERHKKHWMIVTGMHGIVEAEKHADFKYIISQADFFVPDGISLVWLARLKGFNIKKRVSGTDLMQEFFKVADKEGFSNYFYGDTEDTLEKMSKNFPNLKIAGSYSPPFRELTKEEDEEIIEKINQANPDVLWVALGLPKQEKWIFRHRERLNVPVIIGVGAAFKFLSGEVKRAPAWIGNLGFEWLWRFFKEPKVTWKRVFIDTPFFIWLVLLELVGFDNYKKLNE
ncbi:MAG: WecB/TagA/CpsF family glycosyltransferase [Candidatus Staskawiczbacteria bacterium]|jgi:N-acetylglucosaminyldiphosphoundecaprenol N-acetyl-beta-D-mannosaminyltransferase